MLYQRLRHQSPIEICYPPALPQLWREWMQALQYLLPVETPGVLLSSTPACLQSCQELDRWVFSRGGLMDTHTTPPFQVVLLEEADFFPLEQWFLLCSSTFQVVFAISHLEHNALFTFHPTPIADAIRFLADRVEDTAQRRRMLAQLQKYSLMLPDYTLLTKLMGYFLSQTAPLELPIPEMQEIDILQAMMHEVRTPLTTMRTLLLGLLKRKDLSPSVKERLEQIERESREQIDRFNFLFQVVEQSQPVVLQDLNLQDLLQKQLSHWQWQSSRRQIALEYELPTMPLPPIVSNASLLLQLLNGLMDRMLRSLSPESRIHIQTSVVGGYLKLEFSAYPHHPQETLMMRAIGRWLLLQPETGTLSLSLPVTKALFQSLGGKLTIRIHPPLYKRETLTIFLPLAEG